MSFKSVLPQLWMQLSRKEREHLAKVFDIKPTGIIEVRDQTCVSDGYTYQDLMGITPERVAEYVGYPSDNFSLAWAGAIVKCREDLQPKSEIKKQEVSVELSNVEIAPQELQHTQPVEVKKRGRPAKK